MSILDRVKPNSEPPRPTLVLDTNVVLDWLYFQDPRCARLGAALRDGAARWIACASMGDELRQVLHRDVGRRGARAVDATLSGWQRWARIVEPGDAAVPANLRCSDAADQQFIDLAWRLKASALLSADRAVLRLARRAAGHGIAIRRLEDWAPGEPTGPIRMTGATSG